MNWRDEALVVFLVQIRELGQFPRVKLRGQPGKLDLGIHGKSAAAKIPTGEMIKMY